MENTIEDLAVQLFEANAVKFGDFTLKSNVKSPIYFDLRVIVSFPHLMSSLSNMMCTKIQTLTSDHICGVPYTALPIATIMSVTLNKGLLLRRKEAKDYGTKRMIEGRYKLNDNVIIVEDVITTGSSIIETAVELEKEGLKVTHAVVVLDREQGARENLLKRGIEPVILLSTTKLINILIEKNLIPSATGISVLKWIKDTAIALPAAPNWPRVKMGIDERIKCSAPLVKQILCTVQTKKSLLVVAADVTKSQTLLEIARTIGPYIVILKTHVDIISDFTVKTSKELCSIAEEFNFLLMEDRKFCDIGSVVAKQYEQVASWADIVTVHSLPGPGVLDAIKTVAKEHPKPRGCFLVGELSCKGALTDNNYAQASVKMAENYKDIVIGFVCQNKNVFQEPGLLQLTPGVKCAEGNDELGQQYVGPHEAVLSKGADLIVVGRGIISDTDPVATAKKYQNASWEAFCKRIES